MTVKVQTNVLVLGRCLSKCCNWWWDLSKRGHWKYHHAFCHDSSDHDTVCQKFLQLHNEEYIVYWKNGQIEPQALVRWLDFVKRPAQWIFHQRHLSLLELST